MSCRIKHKEFVQEIVSSTNFTSDVFALNPALGTSFPWLSQIAANYQEYKFHSICFYYQSLSADTLDTKNTAEGTVIIAAQMNAVSVSNPFAETSTTFNGFTGVFNTKQQMEQTQNANSCRPQVDMEFHVPLRNPLSVLYCRQQIAPTSVDLRLYDLGIVQVSTVGQTLSNVVLGNLIVEYDVSLLKPVQNPCVATDIYQFPHSLLVDASRNYFGNGGWQYGIGASTLGGVCAGAGATDTSGVCTYVFPPTARAGVYRITYAMQGDQTTNYNSVFTYGSGLIFGKGSNLTSCAGSNPFAPLVTYSPSQYEINTTTSDYEQRIIMVGYFYFNGANAATFGPSSITILNPNSGPGMVQNPATGSTGAYLFVEEVGSALMTGSQLNISYPS